MMNKGYYDTHLPLQGTYIPVMEEDIVSDREVTDEELQAFILGLDIPDKDKAAALAAYNVEISDGQ
jgi:hypothetical protein